MVSWTHGLAFVFGLMAGAGPFLLGLAVLAQRQKDTLLRLSRELLNPSEKVLLGQVLTMEGLGEAVKQEMDIIMGRNVDQEHSQDLDPLDPRNAPKDPGWSPGD